MSKEDKLSAAQKKHIKKLHQKKYRDEFGEFIVEGIKGAREMLASDWTLVHAIVEEGREGVPGLGQILNDVVHRSVPITYATPKDIKDLQTTDTFPGIQLIVSKKNVQLDKLQRGGPIICLDHVSDPGNLGTIVRTADWFGIKNILLSEGCVDLYSPKVVRSTMGSLFHVNTHQSQDVTEDLGELRGSGYKIYSMTMGGESIQKMQSTGKDIYVFGSESHGVSQSLVEMSDGLYSIPGSGQAESLNVAMAAGIIMSRI